MAKPTRREAVQSAVIRQLREERERLGLTQYQVAPRTGLSASTLSLIERELRNPTLDTLLRITEVLEVELGEILLRAEAEVGGKEKADSSGKVLVTRRAKR